MEVGIEDLAFAQHLALAGLRFLHLHDHVGLGENLVRRGDDLGAGLLVVGIAGANACTGLALHPHGVAATHGFTHRGGGHAHTVFMVLDFLRHADEHFGFLRLLKAGEYARASAMFSRRSGAEPRPLENYSAIC